MEIAGLQKLSLIDYPGKLVCTLFLFGCNFKCGFCHNPELVLPKKAANNYSEKEILDFLKNRKKYLNGVCITGGEPLINSKLLEFLEKIKKIGYSIKLDTNGSNPELLRKIIEKKLLDYIAMDIKFDKDNYDIISSINIDISKIEKSIKIIANSNLDYEFRTTVIKGYHNSNNLKRIGKWISELINNKAKRYIIQNFVPRRDKLVDEKFERIKQFTEKELKSLKKSVLNFFENIEIRDN